MRKFPRLELVRAGRKIFPHAKNQPWGLPVSSINYVHTNIFIHIYTNVELARIRLLGRFTTYFAQTTTASRLLFALGWHFIPRECNFFWKFSSLKF